MAVVSRREFLKYGSASAALGYMVTHGIRLHAAPLGLPIGSQMWPHQTLINNTYEGFEKVCRDLKAVGVDSIEAISPSGPFSNLTDGKRLRQICDGAGLVCPSAHFRGLRTPSNWGTLVTFAHDLGMTHMNMASMGGRTANGQTSLEEVKRVCDEFNTLGAQAKREGLQMMTHNEGFENSRLLDGRLTYPVLLEYLDPEMVKMQFQMSSSPTIGDPITYFTHYPGRFESLHLQGVDTSGGMRAVQPPSLTVRPNPAAEGGRGRAGGGGRGGGRGALAAGEDTVDWVKVFEAAKVGGLKNYFVEQQWDTMVRSVNYLKTLNVT